MRKPPIYILSGYKLPNPVRHFDVFKQWVEAKCNRLQQVRFACTCNKVSLHGLKPGNLLD